MTDTIREMMAAQFEADEKAKKTSKPSRYAKDWGCKDRKYREAMAASYDY